MFAHDRVIIKSNEERGFQVGQLTGFTVVNTAIFPEVTCDGTPWLVMGAMISHTDEMEEFLGSLSPQRQWEILSGVTVANTINKG